MTEKPVGERVAHMEGVLEQVLPAVVRMEEKLDTALDGMKEKGSRQAVAEAHAEIDKLQLALEKKPDRAEVDAKVEVVKSEVKQIRERMILWAGAGGVLLLLVTWYGPKLMSMLATK